MGRKHRSSSFGNSNSSSVSNAPQSLSSTAMTLQQHGATTSSSSSNFLHTATAASSSSQQQQQQVDVSSAVSSITTLIHHFVLRNSTTFHDIVATASSSSSSLQNDDNNSQNNNNDALYLLEGLCTKLHELDSSSSSQTSLLQKLLTCQNIESGYNSLHLAIYKRDLFVVLLLLWHATHDCCSSGDEKYDNNSSIVHPLQLLNGVVMQEHHPNGELYII